DVGDGSFISGDGNKFTVYLITATESDTYRADTAIVISGKIENDGIHDIQLGFFMKDNYGNPGGNFIGNNEGRIIVDGDGLAEKISGNKPAPVQNSLSSDERISIGTRQK
ncbi:MAG TPA: hypothetical protein VFF21_03475, partial [Flavobacteriaceae bacterium]|nr:hypothetical protein [Flavobacteriaceae bacterium]